MKKIVTTAAMVATIICTFTGCATDMGSNTVSYDKSSSYQSVDDMDEWYHHVEHEQTVSDIAKLYSELWGCTITEENILSENPQIVNSTVIEGTYIKIPLYVPVEE